MIRRAGRMEPGSGGTVFTGQLVFSSPALTAFTSARLSFLVRPFTEGTVIGGSLAAESVPTLDAVLEAVLGAVGVDEAAPQGVAGAASSTPTAPRTASSTASSVGTDSAAKDPPITVPSVKGRTKKDSLALVKAVRAGPVSYTH